MQNQSPETNFISNTMDRFFTFEDFIPPTNREEALSFFKEIFGNSNPLTVEIGCGNGHFLVDYAQQNPDNNYVGIEILGGRARKAYKKASKRNLNNVAIYKGDAKLFIWEYLYEDMISEFIILFPDPWPKKRHHKHRLLKKGFIKMLAYRLKRDGKITIATDHEGYRDWIIDEFKKVKELQPIMDALYSSYPDNYPKTLFLQRFEDSGKEIYFMQYRKV